MCGPGFDAGSSTRQLMLKRDPSIRRVFPLKTNWIVLEVIKVFNEGRRLEWVETGDSAVAFLNGARTVEVDGDNRILLTGGMATRPYKNRTAAKAAAELLLDANI